MGQRATTISGREPRGVRAWQVLGVAVLGLVAPMFVSAPLSAADTHDAVGGTAALHVTQGEVTR
jgi:hypothetical protein